MYILECPYCDGDLELNEDLLMEDEDGDSYVYCPLCEDAVPLEEVFKKLRTAMKFWAPQQKRKYQQLKKTDVAFRKGRVVKTGKSKKRVYGTEKVDPAQLKAAKKSYYKAMAKGAGEYFVPTFLKAGKKLRLSASEKKALLKKRLGRITSELRGRMTPKRKKQVATA